jgi:hypothetical protein
MLLAGAAVPALAAGDPDHHRNRDGSEQSEPRQHVRSERSDNSERANVDRSSQQHSDGARFRQQQMMMNGGGNNGGNDGAPPVEVRRQRSSGFHQVQPDSNGSSEEARSFRRQQHQNVIRPDINRETQVTQEGGTLRQLDRAEPRVMRSRTPMVSRVPREGTQPPVRLESSRHRVQWNSNWRHDNRYDWRDHRRRHRSIFHLGFYYDPFGWGYRPYSIGWRLWPSYFSSRFWINDPWQYRLPYAPPGTRWIRYYNDAILVDTWTGEVVDVIYDFFW